MPAKAALSGEKSCTRFSTESETSSLPVGSAATPGRGQHAARRAAGRRMSAIQSLRAWKTSMRSLAVSAT